MTKFSKKSKNAIFRKIFQDIVFFKCFLFYKIFCYQNGPLLVKMAVGRQKCGACLLNERFKWGKIFKNGPSKTCGRQIFKGCLPQILLGPFLDTLSQISLQVMITSFPEVFISSKYEFNLNYYFLFGAIFFLPKIGQSIVTTADSIALKSMSQKSLFFCAN